MRNDVLIITQKDNKLDLLLETLNVDFNVFVAEVSNYLDIIDRNKISCILDYTGDIKNLKDLKTNEMSESIPVIIISDKIVLKNVKNYIDAGAFDFFELEEDNKQLNIKIFEAINSNNNPNIKSRDGFDRLCDIFNEETFKNEVNKILDNSNPLDNYYIVKFDINKFTMINYFFGIKYGEDLLKYIARLLSSESQVYDICYGRLSKDRFAFLLKGNDSNLKDIIDDIKKEIKEYNKEYDIELTFGVYEINDPSISVQEMLDYATLAAKSIKGIIGPSFVKYDDKMRNDLALEQSYVSSFDAALKNHEFIIYFQPKYDIIINKLVGAEALVRWGKNGKIISPGEFIPIFERNGLIDKLDRYVWEETVKYIRWRMDNKLPLFGISVNVSRVFLSMNNFIDDVLALVKKYNVPAKYLELEITETIFSNVSLIKNIVEKLRANGFKILMDDFGSGYSGLNVLKDVDFDAIKIDLKFFSRNDKKSQDIIKSVLDIAHAIDIPAIAEGVESQEYIELLKKYGCNYAQGFYYSKPVPVEEFNEICNRDCIPNYNISTSNYINMHHIDMAINDFINVVKDYNDVSDKNIEELFNKILLELKVDVVYLNVASADGSKCIFINSVETDSKYRLQGKILPITVEEYASQCMLYDDDGLSERPGIKLDKQNNYKAVLYYGITRGTVTDGSIGVLDYHNERKWTLEERKAIKLLGRCVSLLISRRRNSLIKEDNIKKEIELKNAYENVKKAHLENINFMSLVINSISGVPVRIIKYNFLKNNGCYYKPVNNKPFLVEDNNIFNELCDLFDSAIDKPDINFSAEIGKLIPGDTRVFRIKSYDGIAQMQRNTSLHTYSIRCQVFDENNDRTLFCLLIDNTELIKANNKGLIEANKLKNVLLNIIINDFIALTRLDLSTNEIYRFDLIDGNIVGRVLNTEWEKLLKAELSLVIEDDAREKLYEALDISNIKKMKPYDPIIIRHSSLYESKGTARDFKTEIKLIIDDDGTKNLIVYTTDISRAVQNVNNLNDKIKKLERLATVDQLTDISNRVGLEYNLADIRNLADSKCNQYLLFLDADFFKEINDNYGHLEGDKALKLIGNSLNYLNDKYKAFSYRIGGDEFVVLINIPKTTKIDVVINKINDYFKGKTDKYIIKLTVGVAKAEYEKFKNLTIDYVNELIEIADLDLREKKKKNNIKR